MNEPVLEMKKIFNMKKMHDSYMNKMLGESNATVGTTIFITAIYQKSFRNQQELSDYVGCNKAHTSRTLLKLQDNGYIRMINTQSNTTIALTEKGKRYAEKCLILKQELNQKLLENINKKDLETFKKVVNQILANAEAINSTLE